MGRSGRPPGCNNCGCVDDTPVDPPSPPPPNPEDPDASGCFGRTVFNPSTGTNVLVTPVFADTLFAKAGKPFSYSIKIEKGISGVGGSTNYIIQTRNGLSAGTMNNGDFLAQPCPGNYLSNFSSSPAWWGRLCNFGMDTNQADRIWCDGCLTNGLNESTTTNFAQIYSCVPPTGPPVSASWWRAGGEFIPYCPTTTASVVNNLPDTYAGACSPKAVKHDVTLLGTSDVINPEYTLHYKNYSDIPGMSDFVNQFGCGWFQIYYNSADYRYIILYGGPSLKLTRVSSSSSTYYVLSFSTSLISTDTDYSALYAALIAKYPGEIGLECDNTMDPASWCCTSSYGGVVRTKLIPGSPLSGPGRFPMGGVVASGFRKFDAWGDAQHRTGTLTGSFSHAGGGLASSCLNLSQVLTEQEYIEFLIANSDYSYPEANLTNTGQPLVTIDMCTSCLEQVNIVDTLTTGGLMSLRHNGGNLLDTLPPSNVVKRNAVGLPSDTFVYAINEVVQGASLGTVLCSMSW